MDKSQLQKEKFESLKDKHRIILRWATGVGKSKQTISLINHVAIIPIEVLLVVAERSHIKNWEEEFEKWGLDEKVKITTICYASLKKYKNTHFDILVLDEAHHAYTEKRFSVLETIQADYIYMLSATLSVKKIIDIESIFGKFTVSTVSLKDAIQDDLLPDPKVHIIEMELDNTVSNQEIVIGNIKNPPVVTWMNRGNYKNRPCKIVCTEKQKYDFYTDKMEYWKRRYEMSHNQFHHNNWVRYGSMRKRFLGNLKTEYVRNLINTLPKKDRFICFCASVDQAVALDETHTISSRRSAKLNQAIINAFNKKQLHKLYAVGMATEGLNLTDIHLGIIVQLDGKERLFVQKFGRVCRADYPICYIFYYKNTQDETYLKSAIENIEDKYIKYCNPEELCKVL